VILSEMSLKIPPTLKSEIQYFNQLEKKPFSISKEWKACVKIQRWVKNFIL